MAKKSKEKFIIFLVAMLICGFVLCHMCGSYTESGSYITAIFELGFLSHVKSTPFDIMHFDIYIYLIGWLSFIAVASYQLFKVEPMKGEYKGIEHGTSHFMTETEMKEFLKTCTTPILKDNEIDGKRV